MWLRIIRKQTLELAVSRTTYHFEKDSKNTHGGTTRRCLPTFLKSTSARFINGAVMLSEALQRNATFLSGSVQIRPEIESLASRTSSATLQLRFAQNDIVR